MKLITLFKNIYNISHSEHKNKYFLNLSGKLIIAFRCRKKDSMKRRRLKLKMPPLAGRGRKDDAKAFASDMCPNGVNDTGFRERDEIV